PARRRRRRGVLPERGAAFHRRRRAEGADPDPRRSASASARPARRRSARRLAFAPASLSPCRPIRPALSDPAVKQVRSAADRTLRGIAPGGSDPGTAKGEAWTTYVHLALIEARPRSSRASSKHRKAP